MSRFDDSGVYMFHRNLFKVATRPDQIRVTSQHRRRGDRQGLGLARDVTPLTRPGLQVGLRRRVQAPAAALRALRAARAENPEIAEIVRMPNKTNGYQRKAQATIGGTGQAAVVISSAAWGHEGGNEITVEFVNQTGNNLPLAVQVTGKAVRVLLATNAAGALVEHRGPGRGGDRGGSQGLIDRAHPYRTNAGTGVVQATATPVALTDFLDQKRTGAPAGEVPRGPYRSARCASATARLQARRADPGVRPRPRVGADDDHARDRRAARAPTRPTRRRRTSSPTSTSSWSRRTTRTARTTRSTTSPPSAGT